MKITFRTFAAFREAVGARELSLTLPPGEKIGGLLERLCLTHPVLRPHLFDGTGRLRPHILVLKNGRSLPPEGQLDRVIEEGDVIAVFPPVGGG